MELRPASSDVWQTISVPRICASGLSRGTLAPMLSWAISASNTGSNPWKRIRRLDIAAHLRLQFERKRTADEASIRRRCSSSLPIRFPGLFGLGTPPLGRKKYWKSGWICIQGGDHILVGNLDETLA